MLEKAKPARDSFTFSLGGMAAINSYAPTPVIADDRINKAWDQRFSEPGQPGAAPARSRLESLLARFRPATV